MYILSCDALIPHFIMAATALHENLFEILPEGKVEACLAAQSPTHTVAQNNECVNRAIRPHN